MILRSCTFSLAAAMSGFRHIFVPIYGDPMLVEFGSMAILRSGASGKDHELRGDLCEDAITTRNPNPLPLTPWGDDSEWVIAV